MELRRKPWSCLLVSFGLLALGMIGGCSNSAEDEPACNAAADCPGLQVCKSGSCVRPDDSTGPRVQWESPEADVVVSGQVTLSVEATDEGVGTEEVTFRLEDAEEPIGSDQDGDDGWQMQWGSGDASEGRRTLVAVARDKLGNETTETRDVIVDQSAPGLAFIAPEMDTVVKGGMGGADSSGYTVEWCLDESDPLLADNPFQVSYRGPRDIQYSLAERINGSPAVELSYETAASDCDPESGTVLPTQAFEWPTPKESGPAFLQVAAETKGGETVTAHRRFVLDNDFPEFGTPPVMRAGDTDQLLDGSSVSGTVNLEASVTDPTSEVTKVRFVVEDAAGDVAYRETDDSPDDGFTATWETNPSDGSVPGGAYTIDLNATDLVGHTATTAGSARDALNTSVTVDNGGPSVSISDPSDGAVVRGEGEPIEAMISDMTTSIEEVELRVNGNSLQVNGGNDASFLWDTTAVQGGETTVSVHAVDAEGNAAQDSVTVTVDNEQPKAFNIDAVSSSVGGTSVQVQASTDDAITSVATYKLLVDGTEVASKPGPSATFSWDSTQVADGPHNLVVRAIDEAGNRRDSSPKNVIVDNDGPTVQIDNPAANSTVRGSVTVIATATDGGSGVDRIEVSPPQLSTVVEQGNSASFEWKTWNSNNGSGTLSVVAFDKAGNSTSTSIPVTVDNQPPTGSFTYPASGATVGGTFTVEVTASDPQSGIQEVTLIDSVGAYQDQHFSPYNFSWASSRVADGSQTLEAEIEDSGGQTTTITRQINVDNTPPTTPTFNTVSSGDRVSGNVNVEIASSDSNAGLQTIELAAAGNTVATSSTSSPASFSWDTSTLPDGGVTLTATAIDDVGNTKTSSINVTVDNAAPSVTLQTPSDGAYVAGSVTIEGTASDATTSISSMEVAIDGTTVASGSSGSISHTWDASSASNGDHTIELSALDAAGNQTSTTTTVSIDRNAPTGLGFANLTDGQLVTDNVTLDVSATDAESGVKELRVSRSDGTSIGTVSGSSGTINWGTYLLTGSYTVKLVAEDNAGNTATITRDINIDNERPQNLSVDNLLTDEIVSGTVPVDISATDLPSGVSTLDSFKVKFRGNIIGSVSGGSGTIMWDTEATTATDGAAGLELIATDKVGNQANTYFNVVVDNEPPFTEFIYFPSRPFSRTMTFDFEASDDYSSVASITFSAPGGYSKTVTTDSGTANWESTTVADGTYQFSLTGTDEQGNSSTVTKTATVDNTSPTDLKFENLTPGQYVTGGTDVDVSAEDATSSIAELNLEVRGGPSIFSDIEDSSSGTISWDTTIASNGSQTLRLTAIDDAGNTATKDIQVQIDNKKPSITSVSPSSGVVTGTVQVDIGANDTHTGVKWIELYDDKGQVGSRQQSNPATFSWDSTRVDDAFGGFTVKVSDEAGNITEDHYSVDVDNDGPWISFNSVSDGDTVSSIKTLDVEGGDTSTSLTDLKLFVDGGGSAAASTSGSPISYNWQTDDGPNGQVPLTVEATDGSNNTTTKTIVADVDNDNVGVTTSQPTANACATTGSNVTITFSLSNYTQPLTDPSNRSLEIDVIYDGTTTQFSRSAGNWSSGTSLSVTWSAPPSARPTSPLKVKVEDGNDEGISENDLAQAVIEGFQVKSNCP